MKIRLWFAALSLLLLAACSNVPQETAVLATACDSAGLTLTAATALDAGGKLTAAQKHAIDVAAATINGVCSQSAAPTDLTGALASVAAAAVTLGPIVGGK